MIRKRDIQRAIRLFKEWDNRRVWETPTSLFINHTFKKAEDSLNTAKALYSLMTNQELKKKALPATDFNSTLWIINSAYYSMFFLAQVLLAKDGKKMPEGTQDSHKTTLLAVLYYFIIKGSGLEGKPGLDWEDISKTRLSDALVILHEAQEAAGMLLQRAKNAVTDLKSELDKRTELTYTTTIDAELSHAKTSIDRAQKFWEIVKEYLEVRK
jgi:uncharacterized protein (UPF0332 family)